MTKQTILGRRLKEAQEKTARKRQRQLSTQSVDTLQGDTTITESGLKVFARVRPILVEETEALHYGCVDMMEPNVAQMYQPIVRYIGPTWVLNTFELDATFGPEARDEDIYSSQIEPLIDRMLAGKVDRATILAYGQTGSGKTHTVTGIQKNLVTHLFQNSTTDIEISAIEIMGTTAKDLLADGAPLVLRETGKGMAAHNMKFLTASDPSELDSILTVASASRTTAATAKNDTSSRSHLVVQLRREGTAEPAWLLTIVDLAGSERAADSTGHSPEVMRQTIENNKHLASLKACIAAATAGKVAPWRDSLLTRYLRHPLATLDGAVLAACVAPSVVDWSHSLNTLRYAEAFSGRSTSLTGVNGTSTNRKAVVPDKDSKVDFCW
ncbi:hypothetical protein HKX48_004325 [Thoreauomyces humboldtii]|nr:hypothetical protein HKX48_004325 [Thoreauomyces humboldtii]